MKNKKGKKYKCYKCGYEWFYRGQGYHSNQDPNQKRIYVTCTNCYRKLRVELLEDEELKVEEPIKKIKEVAKIKWPKFE